jgi:NAD(P)-dependent dehydrogenase (short-subunit alcohol dehydrogenase family)
LGVSLVRALLDVGAAVVWAGRSPSAYDSAGLKSQFGSSSQVQWIDLDVTSDESVRAAADRLGSQVDILINNAESLARAAAREADVESARAQMDINYFGLLRLAQAFGPPMLAAATGAASIAPTAAIPAADAAATASIGGVAVIAATGGVSAPAVGTPMMAWVNLLSVYALSPLPAQSAFSASKAAAYSCAQSLRAEMSRVGIRVINVFPGPIDDEGNREVLLPKMAPAVLARAIAKALQDGVEDVYPGEVAQDWYTRWYNNPMGLERELATDR